MIGARLSGRLVSHSRRVHAATAAAQLAGAASAQREWRSHWACEALALRVPGRAAPLTVVGEFEALVAAGVPPKAADRVMTGQRHPGTQRSDELWEWGDTRRSDVFYYNLDVGPWTGAAIWESGEVLARLLTSSAAWARRLRGARVLELGCGTGLVGLAAAAMGAEVTLTDRVLACAEHNRDLNFAPPERWRCQLRRLSWGDDDAAADLKSSRGPFDFIVTSDTLYESSNQEALAATVSLGAFLNMSIETIPLAGATSNRKFRNVQPVELLSQ